MKKRLQYRKGIYLLPSLFTTGNVFCGFYAFIAVFNDDFGIAGWAIVFAIIFDVLDGRVARLTNTTSEFGEQYDSLADIISFGMAPAFLAYAWVLKPYGRLGWMVAFLFLLCGTLRLARFNSTQPDVKSQHFVGLPIPGAAAVIASIVIAFEDVFTTRLSPIIMVIVVFLLAFLMVSNIKYPAFKKLEFKKRVASLRFLLVIVSLSVMAMFPELALCVISFGFVLWGPISYLKKGKMVPADGPKETTQPD